MEIKVDKKSVKGLLEKFSAGCEKHYWAITCTSIVVGHAMAARYFWKAAKGINNRK